MDINTFKKEFINYLESRDISYTSNLFTFALSDFLKKSNFKQTDIYLNYNEGKLALSTDISSGIHYIYNEDFNNFMEVKSYNSTTLANEKTLDFFRNVKESLNIKDYSSFKENCNNSYFKEDSNDIYDCSKKISVSNYQEHLLYFMKSLYIFNNTNQNKEEFYTIDEKTIFNDYVKMMSLMSENSYHRSVFEHLAVDFFDSPFIENGYIRNDILRKIISLNFENSENSLKKEVSLDGMNSILDDDDYIKILLNSNDREEFIEKSFPVLMNKIKKDFEPIIDLYINKIKTKEQLTFETKGFLEMIEKKYPYMFEGNKIHETAYFNQNYVEFNTNNFGINIFNYNYTRLKTTLVKEENVVFNYENDTAAIMQIYSHFEKVKDFDFICPNNFIYCHNKENLKESFCKYFDYCIANNYIVNPSYKLRMGADKVFLDSFNEALENYPKLIVLNFSKDSDNILRLIREKDLTLKDINKLREKYDLSDNNVFIKILESKDNNFSNNLKA